MIVRDVLQNDLNTHDMAEIVAAVMECCVSRNGVRYALAVRGTMYRKTITPFVEEQARLRLEYAQEEKDLWRDA